MFLKRIVLSDESQKIDVIKPQTDIVEPSGSVATGSVTISDVSNPPSELPLPSAVNNIMMRKGISDAKAKSANKRRSKNSRKRNKRRK